MSKECIGDSQTSRMLSKIESTKDIIMQMQSNLNLSKKSKSVENLAKLCSNKKRKSFV